MDNLDTQRRLLHHYKLPLSLQLEHGGGDCYNVLVALAVPESGK